MWSLPLALALGLVPAQPSSAQAGAHEGERSPHGLFQEAEGNAGAGAKKKKVIRLDAITVEGRIQKPQAFYILQRSNLNFEELNRSESFLPKVEKSVEKEPF